MKELEKMKELWKEVHENNNNYTQLNNNQIMESLSKKSNNVFSKLQKSVKLEFITTALGLPIILWGSFMRDNIGMQIWSIAFSVAGLLLMGVLWQDFRKIQGYSANATNLREQLSEAILQMETFVKLYIKTYMFLYPLVGGLLYVAATRNRFNSTRDLWLFVACVIGSTFFGYFIQKWYTELMYGKYLKELKNLKNELELEA